MQKTPEAEIENDVIDETFRGVSNPSAIHKLGLENIVKDRPGDVLVREVKKHAANGGFAMSDQAEVTDEVVVSQKSKNRIKISEVGNEHVATKNLENSAIEEEQE